MGSGARGAVINGQQSTVHSPESEAMKSLDR